MSKKLRLKKKSINLIILSLVLPFSIALGVNKCLAQDAFSPLVTSSPSVQTIKTDVSVTPSGQVSIDLNQAHSNPVIINLNENDAFNNLANASDKFVQCNIRASWDDFKSLINTAPDNDFMYISFANKMADLGLFDLAELASSKIKDKAIGGISTDSMKRFYYPRKKMRLDNELLLAEAYSNILYNNQSSEATNELLKNEAFLANYDYANYLVALGSYQSGLFSRAAKYINLAIIQNPTNLNYQRLKAQILAQNEDPIEAIKIVDNLKKQNLYSYEYERKINSLEQFVLYKTKKAQWEKDYHLGYYYYLENDSSKAIRTLQSALASKKKANMGLVYSLMSEIYLGINEFEKAADTAQKAYKINDNNPKALITLGDLSYRNKNYKQALNYYKKAASADKKSYQPLVKEALVYQKTSNTKKAQELYAKVLKTYSNSWEAYYNVALLSETDKDKQVIYIKKALAVNPLFNDAWIELAKIDIEKGNYNIAEKYLANAFYIDENDFRYYYYQGLVDNNLGDFTQAKYNFKKCLKINANCEEAKKALDGLLNTEPNVLQDSI